MEARKGKLYNSTPNVNKLRNVFAEHKAPSDIGSPPQHEKKAPVLDMVIEAIMATSVPKKGASYLAIKKWIIANKEVYPSRLPYSLKVALKKGIDKGIIQRPKRCEAVVGAAGSFMLTSQKPVQSSKKTTNKRLVPPDENEILASPSTKADGKTVTVTNLQGPSKNIVSKASKIPRKKAEIDTNSDMKTSSKAGKAPTKKAPSKGKGIKKTAIKLPSKINTANRNEEPTEDEHYDQVSKGAKRGEDPVTAPSKGKGGKKPASKTTKGNKEKVAKDNKEKVAKDNKKRAVREAKKADKA